MKHNLISAESLKQMQATGEWPVVHSELLENKYNDRYKRAGELFDVLNEDIFYALNDINDKQKPTSTVVYDPNIPNKSYAHQYQGAVFGYDVDVMAGPESWNSDTVGKDYVERRKCYIYDWTSKKLPFELPELEYFVEMHNDFKPVLQYYADTCYSDQKDTWNKNLYKLMIIQYNVPTAEENTRVEHRKHNTERFGDEHCDETLGGLHLGENFIEFHAKNTLNSSWEHIDGLEQNSMLWMFGEHAERSGWIPTYHGMTHNSNPQHDTRYSIIFDLQARYNGE
tara:strand:- start:5738 stop:6583 length:846 start_codon:yes stop_codon:yes gene_type:complete